MSSGSLTKPNNRIEIDGNYNATVADRIIAITDITSPIAISLADPRDVGLTEGMLIKDESGLASAILTITITTPFGDIQGSGSFIINTAFGAGRFYSTGMTWFFV